MEYKLLRDVVQLSRGFDLPVSQRNDGRIPVLGATGIVGWHDEAKVTAPGVTIGRSGVIGGATWTAGSYWPLNTSMYVQDFKENNPRFIYYALKNLDFSGYDSGSAQPSLNRNYIDRVKFPAPPLGEQGAIVGVLGSLDDKIVANESAADGAVRVMKAEYSSVPSEGRKILPLSSVAEFVNGRAFTRGASGTGRVVVRIAELNSGISDSTVYNDIEVSDRHLARPGDILMSWSGSLGVFRWFHDEAIVNQHIFKVIPREGWPSWAVYMAIEDKLIEFKEIAADKATTMGHIKRKDLDSVVSVPVGDVRDQLGRRAAGLWNWCLSMRRETLRLVRLRDNLLPALMNGTLTVRTAEELVGEVL